MSAAHRRLKRLPLEIFDQLLELMKRKEELDEEDEDGSGCAYYCPEATMPRRSAEDLRSSICLKLQNAPFLLRRRRRRRRDATTTNGEQQHQHGTLDEVRTVTTVGSLLQLTIPSLLRALDPLLTYGTYCTTA